MQLVEDDNADAEESEDEDDPVCDYGEEEDDESESDVYSDGDSEEVSSDVASDSELSEEGQSWDELEKKAIEEDRKAVMPRNGAQ